MFNRRGFLRTLLAAPVAAVVAFRGATVLVHSLPLTSFEPINLKYTKVLGRMEITPEAMAAMYPRSDAFEEALQRHINEHRSIMLDEMDRQIRGVR